jgi:hypothetical protein
MNLQQPRPVVRVPLSDGTHIVCNFKEVTTHKGASWYEITPDEFLQSIFPKWEEIQLEGPKKRLLFLPFNYIFQVNTEKVIYFSMFDTEDRFLETDLSLIEIHSYLDDIPNEEGSWKEGEPEIIFCPRLDLPLCLEPVQELPLEDILYYTYQDITGEVYNSQEELPEDVELFLELAPSEILKWFKLMYHEGNLVLIQEGTLFLCVNDEPVYWKGISEEYGHYDTYLTCHLADYSRQEVEKVLLELMSLNLIDFEYNLIHLSEEELQNLHNEMQKKA